MSDNATLSDICLSRQARRFCRATLGESAAVGSLRACSRALIRCRIPGPSAASPAAFPAWARRRKRAGKRRRSRLSRRRGARPPRRDRPRKPALGRRFPPAPGARRRGDQRRARRPRRGRGGLTRRVPSHPAGRRSRARGTAAPRLAGALRPLDRALAASFAAAAEVLGVPHDEALQEAIDAAEAGAGDNRPAPFAAAQVFALARRALTQGAGAVAWRPGRGGRAARGLARRRRAGAAAQMAVRPAVARRAAVLGAGRRAGATAPTAPRAQSCSPTPRAAARACDLSAELGRRAQKLLAAQPKLRAKGAGAALQALLDEDSLSASSKIGGQISERGARRLFDRLVALGAVRELTGRATFRLYGL